MRISDERVAVRTSVRPEIKPGEAGVTELERGPIRVDDRATRRASCEDRSRASCVAMIDRHDGKSLALDSPRRRSDPGVGEAAHFLGSVSLAENQDDFGVRRHVIDPSRMISGYRRPEHVPPRTPCLQ